MRTFRRLSRNRTTCIILNRIEVLSSKTFSPSSIPSLKRIGPTWRQAMDASEVSVARPPAPVTPPFFARERWHVTPATFGSSNASMTILSLGPSSLKTVETLPISSAFAAEVPRKRTKAVMNSLIHRLYVSAHGHRWPASKNH